MGKKDKVTKQTEPIAIHKVTGWSFDEICNYYDKLNEDLTHYSNNDDICTSMECVNVMVGYVPEELWKRDNLKVIDVCCGLDAC